MRPLLLALLRKHVAITAVFFGGVGGLSEMLLPRSFLRVSFSFHKLNIAKGIYFSQIHQTIQVPQMEVLAYISCMDTTYVRENAPP